MLKNLVSKPTITLIRLYFWRDRILWRDRIWQKLRMETDEVSLQFKLQISKLIKMHAPRTVERWIIHERRNLIFCIKIGILLYQSLIRAPHRDTSDYYFVRKPIKSYNWKVKVFRRDAKPPSVDTNEIAVGIFFVYTTVVSLRCCT